jgi:hypothetical protein
MIVSACIKEIIKWQNKINLVNLVVDRDKVEEIHLLHNQAEVIKILIRQVKVGIKVVIPHNHHRILHHHVVLS